LGAVEMKILVVPVKPFVCGRDEKLHALLVGGMAYAVA
jgi:hypothetical protein